MRSVAWVILMVLARVAGLGAEKADTEAIAEAQRVARLYLAAVDRGSEQAASGYGFQVERKNPTSGRVTMSSVIPEAAVRSRAESRKRYGKLLERTFERAEVLSEVGSALPLGKYVRLHYTLRFEKKADVREVVVIKVDAPQRGKVAAHTG